ELASRITRATGQPLRAVRPLHSSFEYLNRYYFGDRTSWRLRLVGNGTRSSIITLGYLARLFDRVFHTRTSIYGWAMYFGRIEEEIETAPWSNVCVACGAGHSAAWLIAASLVRHHLMILRSYRCPDCGAGNLFTPDTPARKFAAKLAAPA